jgi:hypothetical protein
VRIRGALVVAIRYWARASSPCLTHVHLIVSFCSSLALSLISRVCGYTAHLSSGELRDSSSPWATAPALIILIVRVPPDSLFGGQLFYCLQFQTAPFAPTHTLYSGLTVVFASPQLTTPSHACTAQRAIEIMTIQKRRSSTRATEIAVAFPARYWVFEAPSSIQSPNSAIYLPFDPSDERLRPRYPCQHTDFDADHVIYDRDSHLEAEIARQRLFSKGAQRGMAALLTRALGLVDVHTGVEPRSYQVPLYF